ncbi:MAG: PQQ-binding-like beta-propeller repeat protein [Planctomycetota bacterium]
MINHKILFAALLGIVVFLAPSCGSYQSQSYSNPALAEIPIENLQKLDFYKKKIQETLPLKSISWDAVIEERIREMSLRGQVLYIETTRPRLYALNANNGTRQWQFQLRAPIDFSVGLVLDLPEQEVAIRNRIVKLTGDLDMEMKSKNRDEAKVQAFRKSLDSSKQSYGVLKQLDSVYFTSGGSIYCLDRANGGLIKQKPLSFVPATAPTATTSYVFMGSLEHYWVYQLDASDFYQRNWFKADAPITGRPAYLHPLLYFVTDEGIIYAYDVDAQIMRWSYNTEKSIKSEMLLDFDTIYVGSTDYALYAINRYSGALEWKIETGAPIMSRPVIDNQENNERILYFRSENNGLYAVALVYIPSKDSYGNDILLPSYKIKWKFPEGKEFLMRGHEYCYVMGIDGRTMYALSSDKGEVMGKYSMDLFPIRVGDREQHAVYISSGDGYIYAVKEQQ